MALAVLLATPALADPARAHAQVEPALPAPAVMSLAQVAVPASLVAAAHRAAHAEEPANDALEDSDSRLIWRQTGVASWYGGPRWHGHRTASGVRYNQNALTAAHATLPIGTRVRVTLEGTGRSVIVVINDRPGTRRRIIDLSRGAAAALGILQKGVAVVSLTRL